MSRVLLLVAKWGGEAMGERGGVGREITLHFDWVTGVVHAWGYCTGDYRVPFGDE